MTREDVQACLKIGAAAATILATTGGPIGYMLHTLDSGVREATTRCETRALSNLTYSHHQHLSAFATYVNARVTLIAIEEEIDMRLDENAELPSNVDVARYRMKSAWEEVKRLGVAAQEAFGRAEDCPRYEGMLR